MWVYDSMWATAARTWERIATITQLQSSSFWKSPYFLLQRWLLSIWWLYYLLFTRKCFFSIMNLCPLEIKDFPENSKTHFSLLEKQGMGTDWKHISVLLSIVIVACLSCMNHASKQKMDSVSNLLQAIVFDLCSRWDNRVGPPVILWGLITF